MTNVAVADELHIWRKTVDDILQRQAWTRSPKLKIAGNKRQTKSAPTPKTPSQNKRLADASRAHLFKTPRVLNWA